MKTRKNKRYPDAIILFSIYAAFVAFRYLFATLTHAYPIYLIDEILYYNIARSIANGSGILYLGQPADYTSIFYPLIISPIYALFPRGSNYMRLMQLWNILLMNLSLFPIFAITKRMTGNRRTAIIVGIVSLLMPDMIIGGALMSESILYPMFFTMMYCAYRYIVEKKLSCILLVGLLGGLIYFTKPGQVVSAAVFLLIMLVVAFQNRSSREVLKVLAGIGSLVGIIALSYILVFKVLHHPAGLFGLYSIQVSASAEQDLWLFAKGIILTPYCFFLCAGFCCLVPLYQFKRYSNEDRIYLILILTSLLVTMLGTAWVVNRVEYSNYSIHTRYIAMYIPLLLAICLAPCQNENKASGMVPWWRKFKDHPVLWTLILYVCLCSVIFGCNAGTQEGASVIFNLGLSFVRTNVLAVVIVLSILIVVGTVWFSWHLSNWKQKTIQVLCISFIAITALINNIIAYPSYSTVIDDLIRVDKTVQDIIGDDEYIYIQGKQSFLHHVYLDVNNPDNTQTVLLQDILPAIMENNGIYEPFLPPQRRGTLPANLTPDTDLLLIDKDAFKWIKLTENARDLCPKELRLHAVKIQREEPWIESMLDVVKEGTVKAGDYCRLYIFPAALRNTAVTVNIDMELSEATELQVYYDRQRCYSFNLPAERDQYSINIPKPQDFIAFRPVNANMQIYSYSIVFNP